VIGRELVVMTHVMLILIVLVVIGLLQLDHWVNHVFGKWKHGEIVIVQMAYILWTQGIALRVPQQLQYRRLNRS